MSEVVTHSFTDPQGRAVTVVGDPDEPVLSGRFLVPYHIAAEVERLFAAVAHLEEQGEELRNQIALLAALVGKEGAPFREIYGALACEIITARAD